MDKIVIDTNVILSGLKSNKGMSFKLLKVIPKNKFKIIVSVPIILEYESVLKSKIKELKLSEQDISTVINYFCKISEHTKIYYLWRPILKDPKDDHILELAVAANAKYIITYNLKDFDESSKFNIKAIRPKDFLISIGEIK